MKALPKTLLLLLFLWLQAKPVSAADKELLYHLISDQQNADIDYPLLDRLKRQQAKVAEELAKDTPDDKITAFHVGSDDLRPLLTKPVKGTARVLTFCALRTGRHSDPSDGKTEFIAHHLLILKVDQQRRVLDGFFFINEWAEPPMLGLLLRIRNHQLILHKDLRVATSDFSQLDGDPPEYFQPAGWLDNLLGFKESF
jgi:hypothetical protein